MNCPFCNAELEKSYAPMYWLCKNTSCFMHHNAMGERLWQALIDGKKAQEALKVARYVLERNDFVDVVKSIDAITEPKEE